ncbi:outer membrane domain protein [Burkholderia pseudomallei]|nr:outer membrane domain protein [Burkholderia pseudomallei]
MSAFATSPPSFAFSRLRSKIGSDNAGPIEPPSASCLNSDAGVSANSPPSAAGFTSG